MRKPVVEVPNAKKVNQLYYYGKKFWDCVSNTAGSAQVNVEENLNALYSLDPFYIVIFLILFAIFLLFLVWFFYFNDRDCCLALSERFGKRVSKFSGKVVWVTGALSGLGKAMALQLAAVGAKLVISGMNTEMLEELKEECIEVSKGKLTEIDILPMTFDITDIGNSIVGTAVDFFGKIDVLVINAAHARIQPSVIVDLDKDRALFEVNYFGCTHLTKLAMAHFLENGEGEILVMSSMTAKMSIPGLASYSASEHALLAFFNSMRYEYQNIPITIACSGLLETTISERACLFGDKKITEEEEEKFAKHGMKPDRCARLALIAAANHLKEAWMASQPFLYWIALAQYCPTIHKWLMKKTFNSRRMEDIYAGKWPSIFTWKPLIPI